METVPPAAPRPLTAAANTLALLLQAVSQQWWGRRWQAGITETAWLVATEPVEATDLVGVDPGAVGPVREALRWWVDHGGVWLDETDDGLVEMPMAHWIASRTPVVEPVSALADPNVQLAVATADTRCARCGTAIGAGDVFGLVQVPDGPAGWCCRDCVTGAA